MIRTQRPGEGDLLEEKLIRPAGNQVDQNKVEDGVFVAVLASGDHVELHLGSGVCDVDRTLICSESDKRSSVLL
jgi:hypothetical protein